MNADAWIALALVLVTAFGLSVPIGLSIRKDAREQAQQQAQATRQAVLDATVPIGADRDYWRTECGRRDDRINQLEDELRTVGRSIPPAPARADDGGRRD